MRYRKRRSLRVSAGCGRPTVDFQSSPSREDDRAVLAAADVIDWSGTGVATLGRGPRVPVVTCIALSVDLCVAAGDSQRAQSILAR